MVSMVDGWICNRDFGIETASRAAPQLPTRAQKYMIPVQCSVVRSHPNNQHDSQENRNVLSEEPSAIVPCGGIFKR